jgi:glycosyltransferase involved in cell wall biosynthesis
MVGYGPLAPLVARTAAELGVAGALAYRAEMGPGRRQELLREASVLWQTAREDNLPQALLEAAASGVVVVSTNVGAAPELLHDGVDGLLVASEDAPRLAEATDRVLRRPFLAESLVKNARLSVERYVWTQHRRTLARLYGFAPLDDAVRELAADQLALDKEAVFGRTEFLWSEPDSAASRSVEPGVRTRKR